MIFETPDGKYKDFVSSDLKNIIINGSDLLYFGIHLKEYIIKDDIVIINGDFILEIREETDGFHLFNFSIEIENFEIINVIENQKLIVKKNI